MTNANALPIQARLRGSVAAAAQAYTDAWFNNPGTARPVHCIPAKETDTDLVLAQGIKEAADRIDALEKALQRVEWEGDEHSQQIARAVLGDSTT